MSEQPVAVNRVSYFFVLLRGTNLSMNFSVLFVFVWGNQRGTQLFPEDPKFSMLLLQVATKGKLQYKWYLHEQNIFHRYKSWCHTGSTLDLSFYPRQLGGNPGVHSWSISQGTSISPGYHSYHREIPPSPFWRNQWSS